MGYNRNMNDSDHLLEVTRSEQYETVEELFRKSRPGSIYYTLLFLSIAIIAPGILLGNIPVVIGGMLITPVLSPLFVVVLGLVTKNPKAVRGTIILLAKSFGIILGVSFVLALLFGVSGEANLLSNTLRDAALYFIIALASGIAATFGWTRKEIADVLPGIAIAVSLVPPLSLAGIWMSVLNVELVRFYGLVFFFNLIGILLGSFVVFSLLEFYKAGRWVEERGREAEEHADHE